MKIKSTDARNLAAQYVNQTRGLYQSSAPVIVQVSEAIKRTVLLDEEVQAAVSNGTQILQGSQAALTAAQAAVSKANRVHGHAQLMLNVASNFQAESLRAQTSANKSLLKVDSVQKNSHRIIRNVSAVNDSSANSLFTAQEALRLGILVKNLSVSEKQVSV